MLPPRLWHWSALAIYSYTITNNYFLHHCYILQQPSLRCELCDVFANFGVNTSAAMTQECGMWTLESRSNIRIVVHIRLRCAISRNSQFRPILYQIIPLRDINDLDCEDNLPDGWDWPSVWGGQGGCSLREDIRGVGKEKRKRLSEQLYQWMMCRRQQPLGLHSEAEHALFPLYLYTNIQNVPNVFHPSKKMFQLAISIYFRS